MKKIVSILAILTLVVAPSSAQLSKKQINLEDIWLKGTFRIKSVLGFNAMNDGQHYTKIDYIDTTAQQINIYDLVSGKKEKLIFDNSKVLFLNKKIQISSYVFSKDESKILILTEPQNIYRRSILYKVYVYDIVQQKLSILTEEKVLHPSFNVSADKIAFVKDNNLYYKDLMQNDIVQITKDGEWNKIINGNCDWVYEEEFSFTKAYQWSPDGNNIAYYRFDESKVPLYTMTIYDSLYPTPYQYKYPKAGEPNSKVDIGIYQIKNKKTIYADIQSENDQYIPRIMWMPSDNNLCILRLNRLQNKLTWLYCNVIDGSCSEMFNENNSAYIDITDNTHFLKNETAFIYTSTISGNNQVYKYNWKSRKQLALSKGKFDIDEVIGVDETNKKVYYTVAENTIERKLNVVNFNGKNNKCISPLSGTHQITPCNGFKYFLDRYSRIDQVPIYTLIDTKGQTIRVLENNDILQKKLEEYSWGKIKLTQIKGSNQMLHSWIITPPNFDSTKKYPVLMYQYSGPGSQMVADKFPIGDYFWHQLLANKGYIIVCADGTGTGFRGEQFKNKTYLQLGKYESDDQIALAKNLKTLKFVDSNRIGIWGWSFGGFMSSTCIFKGADVFKMAIAVAPVTNWRYYDNIYTERYMRTPALNAKGYDDNAPEYMTEHLKGKFLLIHGTADDNVHFQNAVMLTERLIQNNKQFDNAYYPNKNHGIGGGNTRYQLYTKMTNFILQNL